MGLLITVFIFTVLSSALCSMMEGFILSITTAEIEAIKEKHPKKGKRLEKYKSDIEGTSAAILTLNTLCNVAGSATLGYLAGEMLGSTGLAAVTASLTFGILLAGEILPKNAAVIYRAELQGLMIFCLRVVLTLLRPIASIARKIIRWALPRPKALSIEEANEREVLLLVNKGLREGIFSTTERAVIANAIELDDWEAVEIMTPVGKIVGLEADTQMQDVLKQINRINFSRIPVYDGPKSNYIGYVLRDDLLQASALDQHSQMVDELTKPMVLVPADMTVADLLQHFLKSKQKLAFVSSPSQKILGIVTLTDIVELLVGRTHK